MALQDELAKVNAEIAKLSKELGKKATVFDINNLEQAQTYIKGLRSELNDMNSDLSYIVGSFRDSVNELSKQNTELNKAKSAMRKISSISSQLLDLRNETTLVDTDRIDKLQTQARIQFDSLKVAQAIGNFETAQKLEIESAIKAQAVFLAGLEKIKKEQKEIRENFGVGTFGFLGDIADAIPGLSNFTGAFKDAEEAAVGTVKSNKELLKVNLDTGKGLTHARIEELGLTEKLTVEGEKILSGKAAAKKITDEGLMSQVKGQSALVSGTKALGAGLKKAFGPIAIFMAFAEALMEANKQVTEIQKSMALTQGEAAQFRAELSGVSASSKDISVTTSALVETFTSLSKQFGFIANFSGKTLATMTTLTQTIKIGGEAAGNLAAATVSTGEEFDTAYKNALGTSYELQRQAGVQFDLRGILEESGKVTGTIRANLGANIEAIAGAVTEAKLFGSSLEDVAAAGKQMLDFESSIRNELEAELLIGKDLNLERARAAALAGDQATLAKELKKEAGDFEDFSKMNVIQQEALAAAMGMQSDQLADILFQQDIQGKTAKELKAAGKDELANRLEQKNAADAFNATIAMLKDLLVDVMGALSPILQLVGLIGKAFAFIISPIKMAIDAVTGLSPILGGILSFLIAASIAAMVLNASLSFGAGVAIALAAAAVGISFVKGEAKADDLVSPGAESSGYGSRMLVGPEGAISLNNKDTVIAGTNLLRKEDDMVSAGAGDINLQPDNKEGKETNALLKMLVTQNNKKPQISPVGLYSVQ